MSEHICNRCNKTFKYLSYLQRHIACKKQCIESHTENILNEVINNKDTKDAKKNKNKNINTDDNSINNILSLYRHLIDNSNNMDSDKYKFTMDSLNNLINKMSESESKYLEDGLEINPTLVISECKNDKNDNNINNVDIIDEEKKINLLKYLCNNCNGNFSSRQGLHRHKKLNRCTSQNKLPIIGNISEANNNTSNTSNTSGISFNDIINSELLLNTDNSTTIINNTTNNNITNNNTNITINLNPFRCESLEHITLEDFKKIYKSINSIDILLCYYLYKRNQDNISFYKNNVNQAIVSVFNEKMEIEKMTDDNFIKELKKNINDSKIELFYNFKNDLSQDEIIKYMKNLIVYHNNFINNEHDKKSLNDIIKEILDTAFRDKEKKALINSLLKQLNENNEVKKIVQQKYKEITKRKKHKTNDYYKKPEANNNDPKNLYNIKEGINNGIAEEERLRAERLAEIRNRQTQENNRDNRDIYV